MERFNVSHVIVALSALAVAAAVLSRRETRAASDAIPSNIEFLGNHEVLDRATGRLYGYGNGWDKQPTISFVYTEAGKPFRVP